MNWIRNGVALLAIASSAGGLGCGRADGGDGAAIGERHQAILLPGRAVDLPSCGADTRVSGPVTVEEIPGSPLVILHAGEGEARTAVCVGAFDVLDASGLLPGTVHFAGSDPMPADGEKPVQSDPMPADGEKPVQSDPMPADGAKPHNGPEFVKAPGGASRAP